jgi:glucose-1-phosphate adenylyltransferase
MQDVIGFLLGGGRGSALYPLTRHRSVPAVPVAGKYRLIDIPISNCINSGLLRLYVLTQFLSVSLHHHIANTYKFAPFRRGFVEVLAAQQTNETADWYRGTADALRQNIRYLTDDKSRDVLILSGDGLYRMNFNAMVQAHRASNADITIAVVPVARDRASGLGVARVDDSHRILELVEKPKLDGELDALRAPADWLKDRNLHAAGKDHLANMGIYLCRREVLLDILTREPRDNDLVTQHFIPMLQTHDVRAHLFTDYWADLGTSIRSYYDAHLALAGDEPPFDFHSPDGVIFTRMRNLPTSRVDASKLDHALVSDGCFVERGATIERSIVGQRSLVGKNAVLRDTVLTGADRYESAVERAANRERGVPDIGIGEGTTISRAIVDKDCRIGRGAKITNAANVREAETAMYVIRDGIVVLPRGTVVPDGTVI